MIDVLFYVQHQANEITFSTSGETSKLLYCASLRFMVYVDAIRALAAFQFACTSLFVEENPEGSISILPYYCSGEPQDPN